MGVNGYIQELEEQLALWQLLAMIYHTKCESSADYKAAMKTIRQLIKDNEEIEELYNTVLCGSGLL